MFHLNHLIQVRSWELLPLILHLAMKIGLYHRHFAVTLGM